MPTNRKEYMQKYFANPKNYEKMKRQVALFWRKNPHKQKNTNKLNRIKLINILGGSICKTCGFSDIRGLQIDHINGDGNKMRKSFKSSQNMIRFYCKHPIEAKETLQVLCANCNMIKKEVNREFAIPKGPRKYL